MRLVNMKVAVTITFACAFASCVNNDDVPPPHIGGVMPSAAPPGTVATVLGAFFCQTPASKGDDDDTASCDPGSVSFGATPGVVIAWSDSQISVEVPTGAGTVDLSVSVAGRSSNTVTFQIQ